MAARRGRAGTVFTGIWLVVWTSAILVALVLLVHSALAGEWGPVPVLLLWIAAAGFGLWRVGLRFAETLSGERLRPGRKRGRPREWNDGMPGTGREER